jgi:SET domain-containing protein
VSAFASSPRFFNSDMYADMVSGPPDAPWPSQIFGDALDTGRSLKYCAMHSAIAKDVIEVRKSDIEGRGVFARTQITEGSLIETCPVLRVPQTELAHLDKTVVYNYYFAWGDDAGIAFGFGSLYNHSLEPNARYEKNFDRDEVEVYALVEISADEEITLNYGWPWRDQR